MKVIKKLLTLATLCAGLVSTPAAIMVEPTGSAVETFGAQPDVADWSTLAVAGNAAAYTASDILDGDIIGNTFAGDVATPLGSSGTQPPSTSNVARRNTSSSLGLYVQTRPGNNVAYILLMATLQNNTGGAVNFLNVSYTFGTAMGAGIDIGEEIPGLRGFYSMTGDPGSWQPIPQFTTATPGAVTASLDVNNWANGALMYILWADDEASTHNTGTSQEGAYWIDNFQAAPSAGREPSLTAFFGNANGFTAQIQDGTGTLAVNQSTIAATVNGTAAPVQVSKTGDIFTLTHATPAALASNTTNEVVITFNDTATPAKTYTITRSLIIEPYVVIPASLSVAGVDTTSSGFKARMHHIAAARGPGDRNSIANAEKQLQNGFIDPDTNEPYPNQAIDPGTPDGAYAVETVINWNQDAPSDSGNFNASSTPTREDAPLPGIDLGFGSDDIVSEILTFLELKAGVVYRMGVNSDDGFKVTVGKNPRDVFSLVLGSFNGGRAAADSTFDFTVEADGIYPFRLLWWEGTGGASVEWFMVMPDGQKILVNDREVTGHVKAYAVGPTAPLYVKSVSPAAGDTNAPGNVIIEIKLEDSATAVVASTVKLFVNNVDVTANATVTKAAGSTETTITYDPPGVLAPETVLPIRLEFADNATPAVTRTVDYTIKVKPQVLVPLDETQIWKYNRTGDDLGTAWSAFAFDDTDPAQWQEGAPLFADESGATAEPIRTPISRQRDDGAGQIITFYFRTHFNFTGNPAAVNLLLRHVVDDGAVFYLNGVEIHRFGRAANLTFDASTFFSGHENAWEGPFLVPRASLRSGDNVLAAEVHQSDAGSSDVVFGAELYVVADPNAVPARIVAMTPAVGATEIANNAPVTFNLEDGTTQVVQDSIKLTVNGVVVTPTINKPAGGILTQISYTPATPYAPEQPVTGTLEFRDSAGTVTTRDFNYTVAATFEVLFAADDTMMWSYWNTGDDPGVAWREKTFDDSAWLTGPAAFAAGESQAATQDTIRTTLERIGTDGTSNETDYFRTHFNFTGDPATVRLRIRHLVDDGAVFYLNGQEIHRFGFAPDVQVIHGALAGDHENRWEGPFTIPTGALVVGDNVLAVEVHQASLDSSDMVFSMELQRVTSTPPGGTETRFTSATLQADGSIRIQWTGPGTLEEATAIDGTWTPITNAPNPYTATTAGTMKFYRVKQ